MSRFLVVLLLIYWALISVAFFEAGLYLGLTTFDTESEYLTRLIWSFTLYSAPIFVGLYLQKFLHGFALLLIPAVVFSVGLTIGAIQSYNDELPYGLWKTFLILLVLTTAIMWLSFSFGHILLGLIYKLSTGESLTNDRSPD